MGWGGECVTPVLVRSLKLSPLVHSQWLDWCPDWCSRVRFLYSRTFKADIWLSSYDHLTDVGGQKGGCQQLSQRKCAFFLLDKKEALCGLVQVSDDGERKGGQAGRMVASYRYLGVSNPGLQMLGSNECDVSCLHGTRASFQYIRRIPALYYSQA